MASSPLSSEPLAIYLDMNVWIRLAQGISGKSDDWKVRANRLQKTVDAGAAVIPLSAAHYMELWNRGEESSRTDVARAMESLSGYATLGAIHKVQTAELRAEIEYRATGNFNPLQRDQVIGRGVNHAFDSDHGRLRFLTSLATESAPEGGLAQPPEGWEGLQRSGQVWEWLHLAGEQSLIDSGGLDRTPEHRLGAVFAEEENLRRHHWIENPEKWKRLADIILVEEFNRMLDPFNDIIEEMDLDYRSLFKVFSPVPERQRDMRSFIRNIPTAWAHTKLREWKHRDRNLAWHQHDRVDLMSLALALPYCDIVVTEKLWSHLANVSKLSRDFNTSVLPVSKIDHALDALDG